MTDFEKVVQAVERELAKITDAKLSSRIRGLLVTPYPVERDWDYSPLNTRFTCWTVLEYGGNRGIAYCEQGFGPTYPWGLVSVSGRHMSIGQDGAWFASLEDAMRNCGAWEGTNPEAYEVQ